MEGKLANVKHVTGKDAGKEEEADPAKIANKWAKSRCGGRGICQIFGPWDGKRPHGVGKAKFLMVSSPVLCCAFPACLACLWSCVLLACAVVVSQGWHCCINCCAYGDQNLGYVPAVDPYAGDMYDELLVDFDFGRIGGKVSWLCLSFAAPP